MNEALTLCESVIAAAGKFIAKVESGRARSVETYADMVRVKDQAEALRFKLLRSEVEA